MSHRPPRSPAIPASIAVAAAVFAAVLSACDAPFAARLQPTAPVRPPVTVTTRVEPASAGTVTVTGAAAPYRRGDHLQVTAHPAEGWRLLGWTTELGAAGAQSAGAADPGPLGAAPAAASPGPAAGTSPGPAAAPAAASPGPAASPSPGPAAGEPTAAAGAAPRTAAGSAAAGPASPPANPLSLVLSESVTVIARFGPAAYAVTTDVLGNGTVQVSGDGWQPGTPEGSADPDGTAAPGAEITFEAVPAAGNGFSHWEGSAAGAANPATLTVAEPLDLTAVFSAEQFALSYEAVGEGSIAVEVVDGAAGGDTEAGSADPTEGVVYGSEVRLTAEPAPGWRFLHWGDDPADAANPKTLTVTGSRHIRAVFAANEWTVLLYMNGDNELEANLLEDVNELEAVDLSGTGVTVVALVDRADGHATSNGDWRGTRLYRISFDPDGTNTALVSHRLASARMGLSDTGDDEELNLGSAATLSDFLDFAAAEFPAENTALIFWGHGGGYRAASGARTAAGRYGHGHTGAATWSIPGPRGKAPLSTAGHRAVTVDDGSGGDHLLTPELGGALAGRDLDVLAFDLCYGALLEVAYEVRTSAELFIASQDVVGADGWEYDRFLDRFLQGPRDPADFAAAATDVFEASHAQAHRATISVLDLAEIDGVASALDDLSVALVEWIAAGSASQRRATLRDGIFSQVEDFYATPGDLNIDLRDLSRYVASDLGAASAEAAALDAAVAQAVLYSWAGPGNPRAGGLSVHYVPLDSLGYPVVHADSYFADQTATPPLSFVGASEWVPNPSTGTGLLYRLWYEAL